MFGKKQPVHSTAPQKTAPRIIDLECTLEELARGTQKHYDLQRSHTDEYRNVDRTNVPIDITVQRGWKAGTKLTYEGYGDSSFNFAAGDVVFVIQEADHGMYRRDGNDLRHTATITLEQALGGFTVDLPDIVTGTKKRVRVQPLKSSAATVAIKDLGMPISKEPDSRGHLIVDFVVTF